MERAAWTDERLDDLSHKVDLGFARVGADIRDLRRDLSAQVEGLRLTILRVGGGMMVGLVGVIAAILARGG